MPRLRGTAWPMRLRPEEEAVLLCVRAEWSAASLDQLQLLLTGGPRAWDRLWAEAIEQQVEPLVARRLTTEPLCSRLPGPLVEQAQTIRWATLSQNMAIQAELGRIAGALHQRGIAVTPLKGVHLAERLFGALDARRVRDIDLLVQQAQLTEARAVLGELGYAPLAGGPPGLQAHPFHGVPYVKPPPPTTSVVELHWGLSHPRFVSIDYPGLWQRILAASGDDQPLRPLPSEETLLFLALHLPKHPMGVLRLVADVDRLLRGEGRGLDWPHALELAERWQVATLVYFALERARLWFDTPVPEGVLRAVRPAGWRRGAVALFGGPWAILRPRSGSSLRRFRSLLAYCAMLTPLDRSVAAYVHYLFPTPARCWSGVGGWMLVALERLGRGLAWTGLAISTALVDQVRQASSLS